MAMWPAIRWPLVGLASVQKLCTTRVLPASTSSTTTFEAAGGTGRRPTTRRNLTDVPGRILRIPDMRVGQPRSAAAGRRGEVSRHGGPVQVRSGQSGPRATAGQPAFDHLN